MSASAVVEQQTPTIASPWLTGGEAASYLRVSKHVIYRASALGHLRCARIGGRRALRFKTDWLDAYAIENSTPVEERRQRTA